MDIHAERLDKLYKEMLTFAKRQHAIENGMSIEHVHDEVEKSLLDDALKFANMGQQDFSSLRTIRYR